MTYRCLTELDAQATPSMFYFIALQYGHTLWHKGHAGRAILAITRALYANVTANDPIFNDWPLPYAALQWITAQHASDEFPGNPRISFQHQATRFRGDREALRRARAWAVWALICQARPSLPGDTAQKVREPTLPEIEAQLQADGHTGEAELWLSVLLPKT
jgi:hypothetical protein